MGDAADDELALKLGRVLNAVEALGISTKGLDNPTCMRFLKARSMHIDKAAKMYALYHKWRSSFVPLGHVPFDQVSSQLSSGKVVLQGHSKKGFPLMIIFGCKHQPNKRDPDTFKRFVVHVLDKTLASAPPGVEKMVVIVDLKHLSYSNVDLRSFMIAFQMLQDYYPERLGTLYMVNVPKFVHKLWNMIVHFLDKATAEKVLFLEDQNMMEVLLSDVDAVTLPSIYGGKAELVLFQDAHVPNWPPRSVAVPA